MFGWSNNSGKKSATSDKTGSLDLSSLGIEGLGDLDIPINDDFNEADLNDPDLLGELDALGMGLQKNNPKPKPKPKPQPKPQPKANPNPTELIPGDIDALVSLGSLGENDDDPEVEVTEEDFNDPNLLKELQVLGGHQNVENISVKKEKIEEVVLQETQTKTSKGGNDAPNVLISQESSELQIVAESSIETKLQCNDVDVLAKYIQEEKLNAILKKREGDKAGAIEAVKSYKQLEAKREQILSLKKQVSETEIRSESIKAVNTSTTTSITGQQVSSLSSITQEKQEISSRNREIINTLSIRFKQYKEAAITFKTSDVPRAKEFLNTATIIHKTIKSLENGAGLPEGWEIPGEPDVSQRETVPQSPVTPQKKAPVNVTPVSTPKKKVLTVLDDAVNSSVIDEYEQPLTTMTREDQYARLISQLESQVALCTTISAYYFKTGNKIEAATFHRYKKTFAADLTSLTSYLTHGKDVPAFHFRDITYSVENAFLELSANDMEVLIVRAYNLGNKEVNGKDVDAYVSWDIGWPTEGNPGAGSGKGDTSTASRGMDPEFNWKKIINIERTKPFKRYVSSKKATFEVFHYRGFLRKPISLGKTTIKLDSLLNKAEIHQVLDLVDHIRKPTGGKLEIRLRIRIPLENPEVVSKTEKWLIIDEFNANNPAFASLQSISKASTPAPVTPLRNTLQSDPLSATPKTLQTSQQQTPVKSKVASTPQQSLPPSTPTPIRSGSASQTSTTISQQKATLHKTVVTTTTNNEQNELEQAEEQLNNVDYLVSNLVIQHEIEVVNAQIATLEAQRKSVPDDLTDRKNSLDIKQNLLVIKVQTGQLTMDKYLDQVRTDVISCKKLALVFKKAGKLEEAKKALGRSKIMENEVKEVEEAMASGAMGETE